MTEQGPILLFDGVCNLCNKLVIFVIRRDKKKKIRFSPFQSSAGLLLLKSVGISETDIDSLVFIEGTTYTLKSSAILSILKVLGGGWRLIYAFIIVPRFIRDIFYDIIAKHRYGIFGKSDRCMVPTTDISERFLK